MIMGDEFEPDEDFAAEVDAFIASLPEDTERVERITASLPETFFEVLENREAPARVISFEPATPRNWRVFAASVAAAAAVVAMLILVLQAIPEGADPVVEERQPDKRKQPEPARSEYEFMVRFLPDGEPEVVATAVGGEAGDGDAGGAEEAVVASVPDAEVRPVEDVGSWFLKSPRAADPPEGTGGGWARGAIDRFVLAGWEERELHPVDDADRLALLRRLSYDLTGLPPSPELVEHFLSNHSPAAYGNVVEELLAKWQFGEHWGRHWLEVAGFDPDVPEAWRYREYVIAALNSDKPFDRFVVRDAGRPTSRC